jgi:hypothetical protein
MVSEGLVVLHTDIKGLTIGKLDVGVTVGVLVGVLVGVIVGVCVGVLVGVTVGVTLIVGVTVGVTLIVGVTVGVGVGVTQGQSTKTIFILLPTGVLNDLTVIDDPPFIVITSV